MSRHPANGYSVDHMSRKIEETAMRMFCALRMISVLSFATLVGVDAAVAGCVAPGAPAPLLGAGVPALVAFAGSYWAIRKRRKD